MDGMIPDNEPRTPPCLSPSPPTTNTFFSLVPCSSGYARPLCFRPVFARPPKRERGPPLLEAMTDIRGFRLYAIPLKLCCRLVEDMLSM